MININYKCKLVFFLLLSFVLLSCVPKEKPATPSQIVPSAQVEAMPGWQMDWNKAVTEAKKEGRLVMYAAPGNAPAREPFIWAMRENFGIDMEMTVGAGAALTAKLLSERRARIYLADIYMGGSTSILNDLIPQKILEPIEPYLILPEVKDPTAWFGGTLPIWDSQRQSISTLLNITSRIAINTSLLSPTELTSWKDLLKPKLKDKMVMADPTTAGSGLSWSFTALTLMGEDYIKEFVKQNVLLTRDLRLMNEWVARGKYMLAIGVTQGGIAELKQAGAPVSMLPMHKEGSILAHGGGVVAVINMHPHPNAARVFVNWILSKEGQTAFSRTNGIASRRLDVPTNHLEPDMVPDINVKYLFESEEQIRDMYKKIELMRGLFALLLK